MCSGWLGQQACFKSWTPPGRSKPKMIRLAKSERQRKLIKRAAKKLSRKAARKRAEPKFFEVRKAFTPKERCFCTKLPKWLVYLQKFKTFSKHNFKGAADFKGREELLYYKLVENSLLYQKDEIILCEHDYFWNKEEKHHYWRSSSSICLTDDGIRLWICRCVNDDWTVPNVLEW